MPAAAKKAREPVVDPETGEELIPDWDPAGGAVSAPPDTPPTEPKRRAGLKKLPRAKAPDNGAQEPEPEPSADELSLQAWLRSFDLRPGVCYAALTRLRPNEAKDEHGERVVLRGHVEEVDSPIDRAYIEERWGGHTWEITVWERGKNGREVRKATRTEELATPPVAYVDRGRRVALLPDRDAESAEVAPAPRRRRRRRYEPDDYEGYDEQDGYDDDEEEEWRPRKRFFSPLAAGLEQQQAQQQASAFESLAETMRASGQESARFMERAIERLQDQHSEASRPVQYVVESAREQMQRAQEHYQTQLEVIRTAADRQAERDRQSYENNMRLEREARRSEIERLRKDAQADIDRADDRWKSILDAREREIERLTREYDARSRDQRERHEAEMTRAREDASARATQAQQFYEQQAQGYRDRIAELNAKTTSLEALVETLRLKANPDHLAQLQQFSALTEGLRAVGMLPEKDAKQKADDDSMRDMVVKKALSTGERILGSLADRLGGQGAQQPPQTDPWGNPLPPGLPAPGPAPGAAAPGYGGAPVAGPSPGAGPVPGHPPQDRRPGLRVAPPDDVQEAEESVGRDTIAEVMRSLESYRQEGVGVDMLAAGIIEQHPAGDIQALLDIGIDRLRQVAREEGVEGLDSPASRTYMASLFTRIQLLASAPPGPGASLGSAGLGQDVPAAGGPPPATGAPPPPPSSAPGPGPGGEAG